MHTLAVVVCEDEDVVQMDGDRKFPLIGVGLTIMKSRRATNPVFSAAMSAGLSMSHTLLRPCDLLKSSGKVSSPSMVVATPGSLVCLICCPERQQMTDVMPLWTIVLQEVVLYKAVALGG